MAKKSINKFLETIKISRTEEDVKNAYAKFFDITYDTSDRHDLYTPNVLFEFKYDKNFKNLKSRSQIIAQTLYYIRRIKFSAMIDKPIPSFICLADINEAIITETAQWKEFYNDENAKYDWDLAPSMPDKNLVEDISNTQFAHDIHIYSISELAEFTLFAEHLVKILTNEIISNFIDKKVINEANFEEVFYKKEVANYLTTSFH